MGRASILDGQDDEDDTDKFDLAQFQPKAGPDKDAMPAEQVRAVAEASNFPSREAKPRRADVSPAVPVQEPASATPPPAAAPRRQVRRHRTGRTMQLNARTTPETVAGFYAIADAEGWLVGETIEHALAALQRELAAKA